MWHFCSFGASGIWSHETSNSHWPLPQSSPSEKNTVSTLFASFNRFANCQVYALLTTINHESQSTQVLKLKSIIDQRVRRVLLNNSSIVTQFDWVSSSSANVFCAWVAQTNKTIRRISTSVYMSGPNLTWCKRIWNPEVMLYRNFDIL